MTVETTGLAALGDTVTMLGATEDPATTTVLAAAGDDAATTDVPAAAGDEEAAAEGVTTTTEVAGAALDAAAVGLEAAMLEAEADAAEGDEAEATEVAADVAAEEGVEAMAGLKADKAISVRKERSGRGGDERRRCRRRRMWAAVEGLTNGGDEEGEAADVEWERVAVVEEVVGIERGIPEEEGRGVPGVAISSGLGVVFSGRLRAL